MIEMFAYVLFNKYFTLVFIIKASYVIMKKSDLFLKEKYISFNILVFRCL